MRAAVCAELGDESQLRVREVERPEPGAGSVLIRVTAAGVNFPDGLMVRGEYQKTMTPPFVPGCEVAGVVARVGDGVTDLSPGTRVAGFCGTGGFAEFVVVDRPNVVTLPDGISDLEAAGLIVAHGTALHALVDRARLEPGETVLVLGAAGGVGLAAVQIANALGATVIAVASTVDKRELAVANGAHHALGYGPDLRDRCRDLTGGRGVDVVVDVVGGAAAKEALRAMGWAGRYLVVGFAAGEIPSVPFNRLLLNSSSLLGVLWGQWARRNPQDSQRNLVRLIEWVAAGRFRPHVDRTYPLEQAGDALVHVMARRVAGKVVLDVGAAE